MKKIIIILGFLFIIIYIIFYGIPYPRNTKSIFPDRYLEMAVRRAIEKNDGIITPEDCLGITKLELSRVGIDYFRDLEGIQYFRDLENLQAVGGNLNNISALSQLKNLKILDLEFNKIKDISPLSEVTSLEILNINNNHISDVSSLYFLPNLKKVYIRKNNIYDKREFENKKDVVFIFE